jgi:hypothetical protein
MRGMRNKMIHDYFDVDLGVVWNILEKDLPGRKSRLTSCLSNTGPIGDRTSGSADAGQCSSSTDCHPRDSDGLNGHRPVEAISD